MTNVLPEQSPTQRLRPLFSIGVHDVPFLTEDYEASKRREQGEIPVDDDEAGTGWIACTTDSILAMKDTLWDMLITMPPEHSSNAQESVWPVVECPRGKPVKATQRDLRRFNTLRAGLARLAASTSAPRPDSPRSDMDDRVSISHSTSSPRQSPDDCFDKVTEPLSWAALGYNGYMWWASAGEQLRAEEQEESSRDAALLADLAPAPQTPMSVPPVSSRTDLLADSLSSLAARRPSTDDEARLELAIIAYFHRLTAQMLTILSDIVDAADEAYPHPTYRDDEGTSGDSENDALLDEEVSTAQAITIDSRSIEHMGLDVWSAADAAFVQDLVRIYFHRTARIEGKGVEVCGVRVC